MAHGAVVERAMKDFLLISRRVVGKLLDVRVLREEGGGMSSHLLVEGKSRVDHTYLLTWILGVFLLKQRVTAWLPPDP